jgi:hypothetical protein
MLVIIVLFVKILTCLYVVHNVMTLLNKFLFKTLIKLIFEEKFIGIFLQMYYYE